ncbi:hypothetical protein B484DRAFT_400265, partial [Ochromonadaceae sp. CCMP2298]
MYLMPGMLLLLSCMAKQRCSALRIQVQVPGVQRTYYQRAFHSQGPLRCSVGEADIVEADGIVAAEATEAAEAVGAVGVVSQSTVLPGHVYFVATPLGNMQDITERARLTLTHCDYVAAEDTRHTVNLLRLLRIPHKQLIQHH